jgi:transcriptional regulator with XRE-family HTH domain
MRGTQQELAERSGINTSTLSRWLAGKVAPSYEQVITFSRGVGLNPIQGLVMAGYISANEARTTINELRIEDIDELVLLDELKRRAVLRVKG